MGSGIAQVCAASGYTTIVREVDETLLRQGSAGSRRSSTPASAKGK